MATPRINVLSPDGQEGTIPQSQVQQAGAKGYRAVMYDKSGQRGSVPFEQMPQATRSGYTTTPPTPFEKERTPKSSAAWRAMKSLGGDVGGLFTGIGGMLSNPTGSNIERAGQIAQQYEREKEEGRSPIYRGLATGASLLGVANPSSMEQAADRADTAGIGGDWLGQSLPTALGLKEVRGKVGDTLGAATELGGRARVGIAKGLRTNAGTGPIRPLKDIALGVVVPRLDPAETTSLLQGPSISVTKSPYWNQMKPAYRRTPFAGPETVPFKPFKPSESVSRQMRGYGTYDPFAESRSSSVTSRVGGGPLGKTRLGETAGQMGATGSAEGPFAPLVWESPEEAAAHDLRMKNLGRQAHDAGVYSAAQGATKRKLNYQQRIGRKELQ